MKSKISVSLKNVWFALCLMFFLVTGIATPVHAAKNQLTAFSKISPADGAYLTSTSVTLSWENSAGTHLYTWCIIPQGGTVCEKEGVTYGTSVTVNGLTSGTIYSWQVSTETIEDNIEANNGVSWMFRLTAPDPFGKTSPTNGATNQAESVTFRWESSPGTENYEFCYGLDGGCINTYNTGNDTFKTINNLAPNTTYYWRVRALNNFGATYANEGTPTWTFTTAPKPGPFGKMSISNGAEFYISQPESDVFNWGSSSNATRYIYCIDTVDNNQCDVLWKTPLYGTLTWDTINPYTTYYWQVRAINDAGFYTDADDGTWWTFSAISPGHFNKTSPYNLAQVGLSTTLGWYQSGGAVTYHYCYDTTNDNSCSQWVNAGNVTSVSVTGLLPNETYYWQVKAIDRYGNTRLADRNSWLSFTANPPPSGFGKTSPTNSETGLPGSLTLSWSPSSDVAFYEYCVNTTAVCTQWTNKDTATSTEVTGLEPNSVYFWQVRAVNAFGSVNSDADVWWSFATQPDFVSPATPPVTQTATFLSQGNFDGWVLESTESSNKGGTLNIKDKVLLVGDDAANRQYRGILSFDTSSLPENAVVTKLTLKVKKAGLVGTNPFKTHKGLNVDIQRANYGTSPKLQKSDFQTKGSKDLAGRFSNRAVSGWYTAELSSEAYASVNASGVTQFRLRFNKDDNNDFGADYFRFYSGNSGTSSGPQLIVEFYVP